MGRSAESNADIPPRSGGVGAQVRWLRLLGWVAFSALTLGWGWFQGWSKIGTLPTFWIAVCALATTAEFIFVASRLGQADSRDHASIDWAAAFFSYACCCCLVAAANAPVQLASAAWLIGLVAHRIHSPIVQRRLLPELVALWAALAIGCVFRSDQTPIFAIVLLGLIASALLVSLRAGIHAQLATQTPPLKEGEIGPHTQEGDPSWAQQDSILHDLSNAMTASLFMVRDLSRALDKGTDPGLHRARRLSQELVGELSQIGEHIVSSRNSVRLQPIIGATITLPEPVKRCVEIIARLYPDVQCHVECDEAASDAAISTIGGATTVKRILENLLINACQAERTAPEKKVVCRIAVAENSVVLTVEDNGPGFPRVVLDTFPSPMVSTKAQGTGIGLYSCHQMITRDGGTLAISNPSTGGARASISWPKSAAPRTTDNFDPQSEISISGTRARLSERVIVAAEKR